MNPKHQKKERIFKLPDTGFQSEFGPLLSLLVPAEPDIVDQIWTN